jgi:hypothetical protein
VLADHIGGEVLLAPGAAPAMTVRKIVARDTGYGDVYPTTVGGRIVAIGLMLAGIGSDETNAITDALARIERVSGA